MAVELEPAVVAVPAAVVDLAAAELVVADPAPAAEADLAGDQAAADRAVAVPAEEVEPALVRLQDPVLARVRQPRSALVLMHQLAQALALSLVRVRREAPEWAPVAVRL